MRLVLVATPYRARNIAAAERNREYLVAAMRDCFTRGEAPFAGHRLYPGVLDDENEEERNKGMRAAMVWGSQAVALVVYSDLGVSSGMMSDIESMSAMNKRIEFRSLPEWAR